MKNVVLLFVTALLFVSCDKSGFSTMQEGVWKVKSGTFIQAPTELLTNVGITEGAYFEQMDLNMQNSISNGKEREFSFRSNMIFHTSYDNGEVIAVDTLDVRYSEEAGIIGTFRESGDIFRFMPITISKTVASFDVNVISGDQYLGTMLMELEKRDEE